MIRLDTVNRTLQLYLGTAQTTAPLQIVVSYSDQTVSTYLGGTQLSNSNGTTVVTICSAPAASTIRDIDMVNVLNTDTVSKLVTIQLVDTATAYLLVSVTLLVGEKLTYTHGSGWQVVDNSGNVKYVVLSSSGVNSFSAGSTGLTPATATTGAVTLGGTLAVANGGTGTTTPSLVAGTNVSISGSWPNQTINSTSSGSVTSVTGTSPVASSGGATPAISLSASYGDTQNPYASKTANYVLAAPSGTAGAPTFRAIVSADIPTLNQNTTGTAANVSGTVAIANGGTGQTTQSAAITALTGTQTSGRYLRSDGTNAALAAIVAGDVPTLNQNTTGTAANVSGTVAVANGGTGATTAATARSNLSAAQSGANTDITSVTLTTGTISTAPSSSTDIVNKSYADSIASGINFHNACNLATTAALPANTYNNGTSGVGATLTATANAALSVDSVAVTSGQRILVKNESTGANNGVYTVTQVGSASLPYILTRATDYDTSGAGTNEIDQGDLLLVLSGTVNSNTSWVQQTALPITVGTTALVFIQFAAVQTYTAGTGLTLATNQFSITNTGTAGTYGSASAVPVIVTNAQGQVTGVTNTAIAIAGSAVTGNISGNAANVTGTVAVANGGTGLTAGTSGGIPYYSGTSAITSSALLAANALMVGGGSGAAPSTVTTGTGVVTALGVNTGSSGAFVVNGGDLGTPSAGVVTNLTGTASININGTVGATTTNSGAFTSLSYSTTLTGGTGVITIGTNQFYKDASGNIGIGTITPGEKVDVLGNIAVGVTGVANRVNFHRPADSVLGTYVGYHTASNGDFGLFNYSGSGNIRLIGNGGNLIFESTSGTERFRITSSGGASFGTTGTGYGSSGQVLTSNGNASPTWGTLGIGAGGTGQTTASAAFNALSPVTTTGDLIVGSGTNSATRLAIGTNNYVLTSNGTTAIWAANTGGTGISTGKSIAMAMIFGF